MREAKEPKAGVLSDEILFFPGKKTTEKLKRCVGFADLSGDVGQFISFSWLLFQPKTKMLFMASQDLFQLRTMGFVS